MERNITENMICAGDANKYILQIVIISTKGETCVLNSAQLVLQLNNADLACYQEHKFCPLFYLALKNYDF